MQKNMPMTLGPIYKNLKIYRLEKHLQNSPPEPVKMPEPFNGVAVAYERAEAENLPADMAAYLDRVIEGGMKLDPAHVLKVNLLFHDTSIQKLAEKANARVLVIFGTQWLDHLHHANISKNEIVKLYGMKVLCTDTLQVINTDEAAKKAFWAVLKKVL